MNADVVVDIGNTRVKWGRCDASGVRECLALSYDADDWEQQRKTWQPTLSRPAQWVIAGVVPDVVERMRSWAVAHGDRVTVVTSRQQIPVPVDVDQPNTVGLDRLLGALAAQVLHPGKKLLVVDAGSAVTINLIDSVFRGGAIFPGLRLMAEALHTQTAQLPMIQLEQNEDFPGKSTAAAIRAGFCSVVKGAVGECARSCRPDVIVFTGGDGALLESMTEWPCKQYEPALNLRGLWQTAVSMPSPV